MGGPHLLSRSATPEVNASTFQLALTRYGIQSLSHRQLAAYAEGADALDISKHRKIVESIGLHSINRSIHAAYSFTADGKAVISAGGTGTIQTVEGSPVMTTGCRRSHHPRRALPRFRGHAIEPLWNVNTQDLLVSLFHGEGDEWVMWTPQGYYAASGSGAELIGWQG